MGYGGTPVFLEISRTVPWRNLHQTDYIDAPRMLVLADRREKTWAHKGGSWQSP